MEERERLVAYLLGELPEEEQHRLEREYLADDDAYEQLLVVEDELAYDYLEGRLSGDRRSRFESAIGATERGKNNLEFARSVLIALRASRAPAERPQRYWAAALAAALALAILPVWLAFRVASLTGQLERLQAENGRPAVQSPVPTELRFLLTPGLARSEGGPPRLELSAQADLIRFELVTPPGAPSGDYVVTIQAAAGGAQVWSQSAALSGRTLAVTAPAKLFAAGEYGVAVRRLTAGEQSPDLATYSFRLARK